MAAPEEAARACQGVAVQLSGTEQRKRRTRVQISLYRELVYARESGNVEPIALLVGLRFRVFSMADLRCSKRAKAAETADFFFGALLSTCGGFLPGWLPTNEPKCFQQACHQLVRMHESAWHPGQQLQTFQMVRFAWEQE